ncbi:hypothetical protein ABHI18_005095 [Aspergillus niger]
MKAADHTPKSHEDPLASGPNIVPSPDTSAEAQGDSTTALSGSRSTQKVPKKRTKSGCLTCRQRRSECGEEKPICNNCIKSRRDCKGYGSRLVFKDPLGITGTTSQPVTVSTEPFNVPPPSEDLSNAVSQQRQTKSGQPILAVKSIATAIMEMTPQSTTATAPHESPHSRVGSDRPQSNIVSPREYPALREPADTLAFLDQQRSGGLEVRYPTTTGIAYPQGSSVVHGARFARSTSSQAQLYAEAEREDGCYDLDTDEGFHEQKMALDYNQLSLIMASANRDQQQL